MSRLHHIHNVINYDLLGHLNPPSILLISSKEMHVYLDRKRRKTKAEANVISHKTTLPGILCYQNENQIDTPSSPLRIKSDSFLPYLKKFPYILLSSPEVSNIMPAGTLPNSSSTWALLHHFSSTAFVEALGEME